MSGQNKDVTAQNQTERELRESQARLRLALEASGIALWEADLTSSTVFLDSRWTELLGYEPRESTVPLRDLLKLVHPEDRPAAVEQVRLVTRGDSDDYRIEQRLRHRLGHWIWIESRGRVVERDASGRALRLIGTNIDISPIQRQKEFLEALHQTALDLLERHDMDDLLQAIVDRSCALLDASFGELSLVEGDQFVVRAFTKNLLFLRGDRVGRDDALLSWRAYDTGEVVVVDDYAKHQDRREIYEKHPVHGVAIFPILHGKRCLGVLGVSRTQPGHRFSAEEIQRGMMLARQAALVLYNANIYDDAVREADARTVALRESQERFRGVFENSPVMIALLTVPEGRFAEVNAASLATLGYTREEVVGRTSSDMNTWFDVNERQRYLDLLQTHGYVNAFEAQMRRRNGEPFNVLISGSLITFGGQAYSLNTMQDITVQKQAEERLRQSHKIELLGNLAGGIAHDFNNILTGMLSNIELARLDLPRNHIARQWVDRIGATAGHAKNLVQQILTFSRMEEGSLVPTRLQPVVSAAVQLMRTTMPSMMRIDAKINESCPPVMADETQIHQVVLNLCTNAWHALPEHGGRITVELLDDPPNVALIVRDNGCGMDSTVLQRIFEPFFTTKEPGKGTGLGLAVTHGIVKSHSGVITVESAPGKGTTVEIRLPAIEAMAEVAAARPAPSPAAGRNERVLFVDDEPSLGLPLSELITRLGYRVTYESDPTAALATFKSQPFSFDVLLTDLAMPGMTGRELAKEILQIRADLPIILLTGLIEPKQREQLLQNGIRAVLAKPAPIGDVAAALSNSLRR